ncbi:hypothetical protein Mapa_009422 [Marchantia paleacea]|nr:hypothetical protein Mapa_009422 [Marchantia paleacea]
MHRGTAHELELSAGVRKSNKRTMDTFRRVYQNAQKWKGALSRRKRSPDDSEQKKLIPPPPPPPPALPPQADLDRISSFPVASGRIRGSRRLERRKAKKSVDLDCCKPSGSLDLDIVAAQGAQGHGRKPSDNPQDWSVNEYRVLGKNGVEEIGEVCRYLGLPGPEFLGISRDAWDAALSHSSDSTWDSSPLAKPPSSLFSIKNPTRKRKDIASRLSLVVPTDMSPGSGEPRAARDKALDTNSATQSSPAIRHAELDGRGSSRHRDTVQERSADPGSAEIPMPGLVASSSPEGSGSERLVRKSFAPRGRAAEEAGLDRQAKQESVGRAEDHNVGSLASTSTTSHPMSELIVPSSPRAAHAVQEGPKTKISAAGIAGTQEPVNANSSSSDSRAPITEANGIGETGRHVEGECSETRRSSGLDLEDAATWPAQQQTMSMDIRPSPAAAPIAEVQYRVSPDDDEMRIQELLYPRRRGDLLGEGSLGTVYEALDRNGNVCAMKEVSFTKGEKNVQDTIFLIEQGIETLSGFKHKNIVQYLGTQRADGKIYIFQELIRKGSLVSLCKKLRFTNSLVIACTRQILKGLEYLHHVNVVHRDIKCANILIDVHGTCKLADFGLAKQISALEEVKFSKGSAFWMAPEVIDPKKTFGKSADIWSLGCTVIEMFTGGPPFGDQEWVSRTDALQDIKQYRVMWKVVHGEAPPIPEGLSEDAQDFIRQCLIIDPAKRPTASMLLQHKFISRPTNSVN